MTRALIRVRFYSDTHLPEFAPYERLMEIEEIHQCWLNQTLYLGTYLIVCIQACEENYSSYLEVGLRRIVASTPRKRIFVFGSNLAGRHGAGAALAARNKYGAIYGQGFGRQGDSYAIPTKNSLLRTLPLGTIKVYVVGFLGYAEDHPDLTFMVTRIGCGLAGYKDKQIAPFFRGAPNNCVLPVGWRQS